MKQSLFDYIFSNLSLSVFVAVVAYTICGVVLNDFIYSTAYSLVDPDKKIETLTLKYGQHEIEYGKALSKLVVFILLLSIIYIFQE